MTIDEIDEIERLWQDKPWKVSVRKLIADARALLVKYLEVDEEVGCLRDERQDLFKRIEGLERQQKTRELTVESRLRHQRIQASRFDGQDNCQCGDCQLMRRWEQP